LSPSQISIVVVFPAPFGPSSPKHSPALTSRSRPSTAFTVPYALWRPERWVAGFPCIYLRGTERTKENSVITAETAENAESDRADGNGFTASERTARHSMIHSRLRSL
jgi:hypothetical protein